MLNGKTILVTGGTGSFGNAFTQYVLEHFEPKKIIIYSRDEYKQFIMANKFKKYEDKLRFFIGDVRDKDRLYRAFDGVDYVVHAAALKQVPACEYNPMEAVKTINLYGGTKLVSDKLFIAANAYAGAKDVCFSIVRYGNVAGSRGSVIPFFRNLVANGADKLPITDYRMTRFWISLDEGVQLVIKALFEAKGGETFISKIPSFKITDLAQAIRPGCEMPEVGIREGEKLHEIMVTREDSMMTYEYEKHFIVYPHFDWWDSSKIQPGGKKVAPEFEYSSGENDEWLSVQQIAERLKEVEEH